MFKDLSVVLQLAQLIGYVVASAVFVIMIKADIKILRNDFKIMKTVQETANIHISELSKALTIIAVQDSRLKGLEEDFRDLKHGRGFVRIEGEYSSLGSPSSAASER